MVYKIEFKAMGSQIFVAVDSPSMPTELDNLPNWFEDWEQHLSRFRPNSELRNEN